MDKLDILKRDEFVSQLISLVENISENKANTSFAINGAWGCGKSFVLDMFEEQLGMIQSEETYTDKYFIIRYNCWKYDYYEEPLIAIVATIISEIEEKTKLFPDSKEKSEILGMLKATGIALLSMANTALKDKTGLDFKSAVETVVNGEKSGTAEFEKAHDYDGYFAFNKTLNKLSEVLQSLAEKHTVVFLVDELDRCLPEYSVKVLERLHHLTEGNSNIITIVSIDKVQLCSSVKQIFGFEKPEKYLEKFIQFDINLDYGSISEKIHDKYSEYFALFNKDYFKFEDSLEECIQIIFTGLDIRTHEKIIKKSMLAHKLICKEPRDYSFMCMELLLTVFICEYNGSVLFESDSAEGTKIEEIFSVPKRKETPQFFSLLNEKIKMINFRERHTFTGEPVCFVLPDSPSLFGAMAFSWYWMHKSNRYYIIQHTTGDCYSVISKNHEDLRKFAETVYLLK